MSTLLPQRTGPFVSLAATDNGRARRMMALLTIGAALGLVDLALTVAYLDVRGFSEANPIARAVLRLGVPWLVIFKCSGMLLHSAGLWAMRRHTAAEAGAWVSAIILSAMFLVWIETVILLEYQWI